jgi:signal transduction histidine kinase
MLRRTGAHQDGGSANGVAGLAVVAALIVLFACAALALYASASIDTITQAREHRLAERAVDRRLRQLGDDLASVAIWTDAYDRTARRFDRAWAQVNYGTYFHQYLHHDVSLVFDAAGRPIYAAVAGQPVAADALAEFIAGARPLADQARRRGAAKAAAAPGARGFARVGASQAAMRAGSRIYLAAASTVVPEDTDARPLLAGPEPVVLSAIEVGPTYLQSLQSDYGLLAPRRTPHGAASPSVVLRDAQGRPLADLVWTPEQPGRGVLSSARGWIVTVLVATFAAVALVVLRLRGLTSALAGALQRAQAGDRAKSAFVANISHEIRTPLNGVLGMAQIMSTGDLDATQRGRLEVIRQSGDTLLALLDDVLDLAKIESGKLEIHDERFDLQQLVERVGKAFSGSAASKDIALTTRIGPGLEGVWRGDPLRLRQILGNLLSNAIKFTAEGSVTLQATATAHGAEFCVTDTGIGVSPSEAELIFAKFEQADATTTRKFGGSGLGLAICRELAQAMGGGIEVQSQPGLGSVFTLRLPLRRADPQDESAPISLVDRAAPSGALRLLAAEDNPVNQMVLRALLEPLGCDLTLVEDGRAAADLVMEGRKFDLVLMDIHMPRMNGVEATQAIRAHEIAQRRRRTPILALTANVLSHQLAEYRAAGMDGHVAKPIELRALYGALDATLGAMAAEA